MLLLHDYYLHLILLLLHLLLQVYRQSFLLSFSHSPAMKRVITVYKDWIQMNVQVTRRICFDSGFV